MLKRLIKLAISFLVYCGDHLRDAFLSISGKVPRAHAVVLYYHGVSDSERACFAKQMDILSKSVHPIGCLPAQLNPGQRYASVTFDDGFISVLQNALPVLRQNNIPATIFVPSGYLGMAPGWVKESALKNRNEVIVSPSALKSIAQDDLVSIGSHTVTHPRLALLERDKVAHELAASKESLEAIIDRPVDLFSFPHGSFTPEILQMAAEAGYKRVFGINPTLAFQTPKEFLTGRVAVGPSDWTIEYILKLSGAYRWMARTA